MRAGFGGGVFDPKNEAGMTGGLGEDFIVVPGVVADGGEGCLMLPLHLVEELPLQVGPLLGPFLLTRLAFGSLLSFRLLLLHGFLGGFFDLLILASFHGLELLSDSGLILLVA